MMRGEESESNNLVEELGFSGTSRGTRKFEDCRCRIRGGVLAAGAGQMENWVLSADFGIFGGGGQWV